VVASCVGKWTGGVGAVTRLCGHLERVQSVRTRWTDRLCRACLLRSRQVPPQQQRSPRATRRLYLTRVQRPRRLTANGWKIRLTQPARDGPRLPAAGHHRQHNSRPERRHKDRHSPVTGTPHAVTMTCTL